MRVCMSLGWLQSSVEVPNSVVWGYGSCVYKAYGSWKYPNRRILRVPLKLGKSVSPLIKSAFEYLCTTKYGHCVLGGYILHMYNRGTSQYVCWWGGGLQFVNCVGAWCCVFVFIVCWYALSYYLYSLHQQDSKAKKKTTHGYQSAELKKVNSTGSYS